MRRSLLSGALILITLICYSQPSTPPTDPDAPVPITGIEILIGAGALLGAKKLLQRKAK